MSPLWEVPQISREKVRELINRIKEEGYESLSGPEQMRLSAFFARNVKEKELFALYAQAYAESMKR